MHRIAALLSPFLLLGTLALLVYKGTNNPSLAVIAGVAGLVLSQSVSGYLAGVVAGSTLRAEQWLVPGHWISSPTGFAGTIDELHGRVLILTTDDGGTQRVPATAVLSAVSTIYRTKPIPPKE